jgi:hypothetical protein
LFQPILGDRIVEIWTKLLVDRDFLLPSELQKDLKGSRSKDDFVRYTCGQPMGALSSWSSMAMVHHFLVQYSAWKCGYLTWFSDYLVLGDDVVIANKRVAEMYQAILLSFGIQIGLAKSFISTTGMFNFANQSYVGFHNISPLSLREEAGIDSLDARMELALRAVRRGWKDLTGNHWVKNLVTMFVSPQLWTEIVSDLRRSTTHPVVSWILAVLLVPTSTRLSCIGIREVSINAFLTALKPVRSSLWSKSLQTINTEVGTSIVGELLIIKILATSAERLYKSFLEQRLLLKEFNTWLVKNTDVTVAYVLTRIFTEVKARQIENWATDYRIFIKKITIMKGIGDAFLWEHTFGMPLSEIFKIYLEAAMAIPRLPDFKSGGASALVPRTTISQSDLERFIKNVKILGAVETNEMCSTMYSTDHKDRLSSASQRMTPNKQRPARGAENPTSA